MLRTRPRPQVEAQETSEEAAREIGRELREAREARGERLEDIADYLRIRPGYLEALEAGELDRIPGRPYVVGFLRSYGGYLGLDGPSLVARLKTASERIVAPPELNYREPVAETRRGTAVMMTASLLLAAAVYTGYYVIYHVDRGPSEPVAEAPGEVARLASETLRRSDELLASRARTPAAPARAVAEPPAQLVASESADASSAVAREVPHEPAHAATPSSASAAPASARELLAALESDRVARDRPAAALSGDPGGRLSLVARESSWIQIRSASRDYVRTRTLQPGERFTVPNRSDLALWTGNAGGLEVVIDGQSRGTLGQPGQVVKNLLLDPDQLGSTAAR